MADSWMSKLWVDVKGNAKWDAIKYGGSLLVAAAYFLLQKVRHLEFDWLVGIGLFIASLLVLIYAGRAGKGVGASAVSQTSGANPLPDAASAFDVNQFFRSAYYSPLQPEIESNMRNAAAQNQPNDREGFYLKFISLGFVAYNYDWVWLTIYRSQIEALLDLNKHNGLLPLSGFKTHYDNAAVTYADDYNGSNITLDAWLAYLISQKLIIRHASDMIEITVAGKDFLKYLLHWGREANQRRF